MQHLAPGDIKELLALLQSALEMPESERDGWLAALDLSKSHLRPTIAGLLQKQALHETDEFLRELSNHTGSVAREISIAPSPFTGALVGPYRLLRAIGEG